MFPVKIFIILFPQLTEGQALSVDDDIDLIIFLSLFEKVYEMKRVTGYISVCILCVSV